MKGEIEVRKGDTSPVIEVTASDLVVTTDWTCTLEVIDATGAALLSRAVTDTNDAQNAFLAYLTPAETDALAVETYKLVIELTNASLTPPFNREDEYALFVEPELEVGDLAGLVVLAKGTNSFDTYENLLNQLAQMPDLKAAHGASRARLKASLVSAYHNIGQVTVDFGVYDSANSEYKVSTVDFTEAEIDALTARAQLALVRAQLIEANCILGGNPVEDRRRAGMLSDSVGESAIFFRTSKPLELPIYKQTAWALKGYLVWAKSIGRG